MISLDNARSLVCDHCWSKIFDTEQFRQVCCDDRRGVTAGQYYSVNTKKTVQQVNEGANDNCQWCSFLFTFITLQAACTSDNVLSISLGNFFPSYATPVGSNTYHLAIHWEAGHLGGGWSLRLHAFTEPSNPAASFVTARRRSDLVSPDVSSQQILSWISECGTHQRCPKPTQMELPTRVIEVSPDGPLSKPRVLTSLGRSGEYVTLSYCWGGDVSAKLTSANVDAYSECFEPETLPRTIRDAIEITRSIGIQYLWVDSLCILQDSPADVQREISRMERVYSDCLLTIVAACSERSTDGILHRRENNLVTYEIPFSLGEGRFGTMSIGDLDDIEYDETKESIHQRAWTLQESLLPSRFLVYSTHTLQWRCQTELWNLDDSLHIVSYAEDEEHSESLRVLSALNPNPTTDMSRWTRLVQVYARRSGSLPNDKLNAIAAVAKRFASSLGPGYYAGVWQQSFFRQVAWIPDSSWSSRYINRQPIEYRAPSWSWASIDGEMSYEEDTFAADSELELYKCAMVSCETSLKYPTNVFGEVVAGSITIKGVLRRAWLIPATRRILWLVGDESLEAAEAQVSSEFERGADRRDDQSDASYEEQIRHDGFHDEGQDQAPIMVDCLPILKHGETISMGMLLITPSNGRYKRVGSFQRIDVACFEHLPIQTLTIE